MKIGVFDSGLGGHYTLEKCQKLYPQHTFVGFFDSHNAPYGDKTVAEVYRLTEAGVNNLFDQECSLVLIACNTACTQALRRLQEKYSNRNILGCLIPAAEMAVDLGATKIGLIGTTRTIQSKKYEREVFKLNPRAKIFSTATPKLVPWIELSQEQGSECKRYLERVIQTLINKHDITTLILGCTHYSILKSTLEGLFPNISFVDSSEAQAEKLSDYIMRHPELQQ